MIEGKGKVLGLAIMTFAVLAALFCLLVMPDHAAAQYRVTTCADCHAYPPADATGTRGTPTGAVIGSHGEHSATYAMLCTVCHIDNGANLGHRDGHIDVNASLRGGTYSLGQTITVRNNPTLGNCSTVACHSNGVASGTLYAIPVWGNAATGACGTCHGVSASNPPTSTRHAQHVATAQGYKFACSKCHSAVVNVTSDATVTSSITSTTLHVNFAYNVAFDNTNAGANAYVGGTQTCSNLYCHSKGTASGTPYSMPNTTATWAITLSCEGCHNFDKNATNKMNSGSHSAHVVTGSYGCQRCHSLT
ncbi:MAG: CxxxxCH/CxxCH domain-containing protein, partial [Nitrospiraceae bacterium]|nr:CxxxxCH/CxxCH domain-containing protein [Nitrospiraceae bacterium]